MLFGDRQMLVGDRHTVFGHRHRIGRLLSTSGKTLVCPNGNEFKPANTVIKQFEDALVSGKYFQIRCKRCDKCPSKTQSWKIFKMLPSLIKRLPWSNKRLGAR